MRYLRLLLPAIVLTVFFASCEKDPELINGTINLQIYPKVGTEDLVLGQEYLDEQDYRIKVSMLKVYLSHITLLSDNGEVEIEDYALIDLYQIAAGEPFTISADVPAGNYTGIKFYVGLDNAQNATDPATLPQTDPLSTYQGTFWTWNTGYRFIMFEGNYDTVPNTTGPVSSSLSFTYHPGTNPLYREAVLGSASTSFIIPEEDSYTYSLDMDVNKFFYGPQTLDRKTESFTHTTGSVALATKFMENVAHSFSLSNP